MTDIAAIHPRYTTLARRYAAAVSQPPPTGTLPTVASHAPSMLLLVPYVAAEGPPPAAGQRDAETLATDVLDALTDAVAQLLVATHHVWSGACH